MKKKVLALMSALVLTVGSSMTVFAESPTTGNTEQPVATQTADTSVNQTNTTDGYAAGTLASEGFTVLKVSQGTAEAAAVAIQNLLLNDLATTGAVLGRADIAGAATDDNANVEAQILSVVDVDPTTAVKDAEGFYNVTLGMAGISAGDVIVVLHYNGTGWDVIIPSAVADGAVAFRTASLSPISVIKLKLTSDDTTAQTVVASPQTGDAAPYAAVAMIMVGVAGAVVCGKRFAAVK